MWINLSVGGAPPFLQDDGLIDGRIGGETDPVKGLLLATLGSLPLPLGLGVQARAMVLERAGFRVQGLYGLGVLGFRVQGLGVVGFRV